MKRSVLLMAAGATLLANSLLAEAARKPYLIALRGPAASFRLPFGEEGREVKRFHSVEGMAVELTDEEAARLRKSPRVRYLEPDRELQLLTSGPVATDARNRAGQTVPYGIGMLNARAVWPLGRGNAIKVGVIDTGIDITHPDLAAVYKGGHDFANRDDIPEDQQGHGTHVAGTIAAIDNDFGVVGVAPNVELYALKVFGASGGARTADVILAVDWAIANGLKVINLSLGSEERSALEEAAFQRAYDAGVIAIAASGNSYETRPPGFVDFPAGYSTVLAVGAIDESSRIAGFSQRGSDLELVAPGVGVLSSVIGGSGTFSAITFEDGSYVDAIGMMGSPNATVSGKFVFCGLGRRGEFPSSVAGNIALIERGELKFHEKVRNAVSAGARAAIIFNREPGNFSGTLFDVEDPTTQTFPWPLTLSVSQEDGVRMKTMSNTQVTARTEPDSYAELQGTSMATPHVAGAAALIWSLAPNASMVQVREALVSTARDLGAASFDTTFGYGVVDALAAARKLAPNRFTSCCKIRRR